MYKIVIAMCMLAVSVSAFAQVSVKGYTKKDGTYVAPHIRSSPNSTTSDNYGPSSSSPLYTGRGSVTPPSTRDADGDGVANMFDLDDDNDGASDDADSSQYSYGGAKSILPTSLGGSGLSLPTSDSNFDACRFGYYNCDKSRLTIEQRQLLGL